MTLYPVQSIILAAGKSKRFNNGKSKLLEKICGQEMVLYPLALMQQLHIRTLVVLGHEREKISATIREKCADYAQFVYQEEQLGTGHAVMCTTAHLTEENILIMNSDMPLITPSLLEQLIEKHITTQATVSFVTAHNSDLASGAYGRIVQENNKISIIEAKEFTGDASVHCCINAGIYIVKKDFLIRTLSSLKKNNTSTEFQITDLVAIAHEQALTVTMVSAPYDEIRGVNTYKELWEVEHIKKSALIKYWMENGVRFSVAHHITIDLNVTIGAGTSVGSGVHLTQGSKIGAHCTIGAFTLIENSIVEDNATVLSHCVIKDSHVRAHAEVGPFAHVRNHVVIGEKAHIGNFVELKKSTIGTESKIKHLSYLGDASIGDNVNIGAGTITCNFDGIVKHKTIIEDRAYIGANNTLIAPIKLGTNCFTAAGSVITEDVPQDALGIGRARQINKLEYAVKLKKKKANAHASALTNIHE